MIATARRDALPLQARAAARPHARAAGVGDRASIARSPGAGAVANRTDPLAARLERCVEQRTLARWHVVNSGAYGQASPVGAIGSPFTWQEEGISVRKRPANRPGRGIKYRQHNPAAPALQVSADNTLAIQRRPGGQAKEIYIAPAARTAANTALANKGSPIKLGKAGHTITINPNTPAAVTLEKMRPEIRAAVPGAAQLNADDFPKLAAVICRDVAESLLGGRMTHIRLRDTAGNVRDVASDTTNANIVKGTQQLAQAVANGKISLGTAATKMALKKVPTPSKSYGKATRKAKFTQRAQNLGINEYAWARTGESYVIQSTYGAKGDTKNYSDPLEPNVVGGFGYHFAAVVAESTDGGDAVTLENYRRTGEVDTAAIALLQDLRNRYAAQLAIALSNTGGAALRPQEEIGAILYYVENNVAADFNQAYAKWGQVVAESITPGALWYFRMVGRNNTAQSFHRQCAPSGWYVSPITFVMTNGRAPARATTPAAPRGRATRRRASGGSRTRWRRRR